MAVDEAARHQLYTKLEEMLGAQPTSTLMTLLPPVGWADVATKDDLHALEASLRGDIAELRGGFGELRGEFGELRGEVGGRIADLETRITTAFRQQTFALVAAMLSISTLTVAAASIL